jgi:hypothetical protein
MEDGRWGEAGDGLPFLFGSGRLGPQMGTTWGRFFALLRVVVGRRMGAGELWDLSWIEELLERGRHETNGL